MKHILVSVTPAPGHVNPLLTVARHLQDSGYRITFNTGELFRRQVESAGLKFIPLTGKANWDFRDLAASFPDRYDQEPGPQRINYDIAHIFGDSIPDQDRCMRQIMAESAVDLILVDTTFMGIFPMLLGPRASRPPIIGCGVVPMMLSSIDIGSFSIPDSSPEGRERNQKANDQFRAMTEPGSDHMNRVLHELGLPSLLGSCFDCMHTMPDLFLEFTADSFEFPRSDMPSSVRFVGPVLPSPTGDFHAPAWWPELDDGRSVVLVTQGTIANLDLGQLIEPTLAGLADENVHVIAALGRDPKGISIPIPDNARVESFIPFDMIMPRANVFITNGGYGSVNHALSAGVPIVVAGTTDDKAFVSARIEWSGAGINLNTDNPSANQIRDAVHAVLTDARYRNRARAMQANFATYNAFMELASAIESLLAERDRPQLAGVAR